MKDRRPYICKKLKQMNDTGEPVWITLSKGYRYKCLPFDPQEDEWPLWDQGWFLCKNRGHYNIFWVRAGSGGRSYFSKGSQYSGFYSSDKNILAKVDLGNKFRHLEKDEVEPMPDDVCWNDQDENGDPIIRSKSVPECITEMREMAKATLFKDPYQTDKEALDDFIALHWGWVEKVES